MLEEPTSGLDPLLLLVFLGLVRVEGDRAQMTGGFDVDRAAFGIGTSGPWNRAVSRQVNVQVSLRARRAA